MPGFMLTPACINGSLYFFFNEISIIEACRTVGINIPRFCYHESLSIAGNCRMCLVEIEDIPKPVAACSTLISDFMIISTESPSVLKARENILEFLLLNHPLDCPICDQAGECDLQDQSFFFGTNVSRNFFFKRGVEDKKISHIIKTIMTRCIHCTKCVRFGEEICGVKFFGTLNRGVNSEIGNYVVKLCLSEISANVIELCPVGALTLSSSSFQTRNWEIQTCSSIDLTDNLGSNVYLSFRGKEFIKVLPKKNIKINDCWITNKARFYYDLMQPMIIAAVNNIKKYLSSLILPALFLFNPDLDLSTLSLFKKLSVKKHFSVKLFNSAPLKSNFSIWNNKLKINCLIGSKKFFFFLTSNLQAELPLLNVRLRTQIKESSKAFGFNSYFKSDYPIRFTRFTILDFISLIKGSSNYFSSYITNSFSIFFFNKALFDRLDPIMLNLFSLKSLNFYFTSSYCNSEASNYLYFKNYNYKESLFCKQVYALSLDDNYSLRKNFTFSKIRWVNLMPVTLLNYLPQNSWLLLDINQLPGLYINIEQRVQKYSTSTFFNSCLSLKSFITYIYLFLTLSLDNSFFFNIKNHSFALKFIKFIEIKESYISFYIFEKRKIFFNSSSNFNFCFYKFLPFKSILEDPYRNSLQLKYSRTLIESSRLLRLELGIY